MVATKTKRLSKITARTVNALILGLTGLVMVLFNALTPLISDDYTYLLRYPTNEKIHSLGDIFLSQYENYQLWSGRVVSLFLNQLFLWVGKWSFNLCNAAAFCAVVWLCAKLVCGRRPVHPVLLLAALGLLFHFNPCFGAVNLWVCGSCVYLWPLLFTCLFLLPYRLELDESLNWDKKAILLVFVAGVFAGWSNENTGGAALLAALLFLVQHKLLGGRLHLWQISGFVGSIVGFALLMTAPGQWVRMDSVVTSEADTRSTLTILLTRLMNATHSLKVYGLVLVVAFLALYALLIAARPGWKALLLSGSYFVLALAANYALVLCPVYYVRSFYPVLVFLVLAILSCLDGLRAEPLPGVKRALLVLTAGAMGALVCFDLLEGGYDIASYYMMRTVRENIIRAEIAAGETVIETYAVFPYTRFCGAWGQPDLRTDPYNWVNTNMALELGAEYISATEQHYYPFPGYDDFSNTVEMEMSLGLE